MRIRRFGRRRTRRRSLGRGRRRVRRSFRGRARVGRAKSSVVVGRYACENVFAAAIGPGLAVINTPAFFDNTIGMYTSAGGLTNALVYRFRPSIACLRRAVTGDPAYDAYAAIYDQVRVLSVTFVFTPPMGLASVLTTPVIANSQTPLLLNLPPRYPDFTWFDFDNQTTITSTLPADGDYTTACTSKWSAKAHPFGRPIIRTLYPRGLVQVSDVNNNFGIAQQIRHGWQQNVTQQTYLGDLWMAIAYRGTAANSQPEINYSCKQYYKLAHRMPLFG